MRVDPDTCRDPDLLAAEIRRLQRVIDAGWTLTDAEREAVEACAVLAEKTDLMVNGFGDWKPRAATLRGLLERTVEK